MSCEGKCELVEFKITSSRFLHVVPRPRADAPPDLEQRLDEEVKAAVERSHHECGDGCDCVIGEPIEVLSRQQIKKVTHGGFAGWYQITVAKYRTPASACRGRTPCLKVCAMADRAGRAPRPESPAPSAGQVGGRVGVC